MLFRAGFVAVLVPVNVSGFRPVLARGWHGQTSSLSGIPGNAYAFVSQQLAASTVRSRPLASGAVSLDRYSVGYSAVPHP
jgi:hypothetical protein